MMKTQQRDAKGAARNRLTAAERQAIEKILSAERDRVLRSARGLGASNQLDADAKIGGDAADLGSAITHRENASLLAERGLQRLRELDEALARLANDPDFGNCAACGDPIQFARLEILPTTKHCAMHAPA